VEAAVAAWLVGEHDGWWWRVRAAVEAWLRPESEKCAAFAPLTKKMCGFLYWASWVVHSL
jgi:hypothetical protein